MCLQQGLASQVHVHQWSYIILALCGLTLQGKLIMYYVTEFITMRPNPSTKTTQVNIDASPTQWFFHYNMQSKLYTTMYNWARITLPWNSLFDILQSGHISSSLLHLGLFKWSRPSTYTFIYLIIKHRYEYMYTS